jgi:PAS domain S-box-containing protein
MAHVDANALKNRLGRLLALLAAAAGVGGLLLLSLSVENYEEFSSLQLWSLAGNAFAVLVLAYLLTRKVVQLVRDYRSHVPGSRLTARTVGIFGTLVAAPLIVVYLFSLEYLNRGIDSWFQSEIRTPIYEAVLLTRSALNVRQREQLRRTQALAHQLGFVNGHELLQLLDATRRDNGDSQVVVYDANNRALAASSEVISILPGVQPREVLLELAAGRDYVSLRTGEESRYLITAAARLPGILGAPAGRYLVITHAVPEELAGPAEAVQRAYNQYAELANGRQLLKYSFQLAMTLVVLLTLLAAIYGAIFSAQRLTRPVQDLIAGTRAVGKGDFGTKVPRPSRDEMGFLVHSFNDMTKRLRRLNAEAEASQQAVERERARLEVILSRLSSGVLVIDGDLRVKNANAAASSILGYDLDRASGKSLASLPKQGPVLQQFVSELRRRLQQGQKEWREQLNLSAGAGGRMLLWACTVLPDQTQDRGLVIVFDDISLLLTAQRNAAWGEVARRLAHEIKNPLTPIQLSAEHLRRKLHGELNSESAQLLDRATHTIVQQVDAMQQMVNAFSDYARSPELNLTRFSLHQLVHEVAELYRLQDPALEIKLSLAADVGEIEADRGRIRQLLANLISNAMQAVAEQSLRRVDIETLLADAAVPAADRRVQLRVSDNGAGFSEELLERAFEPYVTSKARGTGLGLAIVKRIVEEHGGQVTASNREGGGASVCVILPQNAGRTAATRRERA